MILSSIARGNKKCATRIPYRHCTSSLLHRVDCKRPHGRIAYSTLLGDNRPGVPILPHERSQRFNVRTNYLLAFSTNQSVSPDPDTDGFRDRRGGAAKKKSNTKKSSKQTGNKIRNRKMSFERIASSNAQDNLRSHKTGSSVEKMPSKINEKREMSFERVALSNAQGKFSDKNKALQDLSQRIAFIFSDVNLRNNEHARSNLQKYKNQYLPLKDILEIGAIKHHITDNQDPLAMVTRAIGVANKDASSSPGQPTAQLHIRETNSGETIVTRSYPFNYTESVANSHSKMMVVEGWPMRKKDHPPGWKHALPKIRSLLRDEIPVSYYRYDYIHGTVAIEYESEEGSMKAWENLEQASSQVGTELSTGDIAVQNLLPDEPKPSSSYQLRVGEFSMVVRSIDMSLIEEEIKNDTDEVIEQESFLEPETKKAERDTDRMVSDDEQSNSFSQILLKSTTSESVVDSKAVDEPSLPNQPVVRIRWEADGTLSLSQFTRAMDQLYDEHLTLPPPSQDWLHDYRSADKLHQRSNFAQYGELQDRLLAQRQDICRDVDSIVSSVKASIDQGKIRALGGRDDNSLYDSLGRAMLIYSETPSGFDGGSHERSEAEIDGSNEAVTMPAISPYDACLDIFNILRSLNLDIHPTHFAYAIRAACHESRWDDATKLFLGQINGDDTGNSDLAMAGFVPIDSTQGWDQPLEMGLYAVTRSLLSKSRGENSDTSLSKHVFDTAMRMCLMSPSGQENYILAAGSALGRAGLWRDCLDFATDPDSLTSYGPSIAAAAMLACIKCSRSTEAIDAYGMFMSGNQSAASEWQWGGGNITAVKPLCRDLALSAMGNGNATRGFSRDAMRIFSEIIDEDSSVSTNALLGLAHSLEHDGDWQSSIQLLRRCVGNSRWRIVPDALQVNKNDSSTNKETYNPSDQNHLLANILASVMRVCNYRGQHGLAILLCSIANNSLVSECTVIDHNWVEQENSEFVNAINSQRILSENEEVFSCYIQSLHGLGCTSAANKLLNASQNGRNINALMPRVAWRKDLPHAESWINAFVAFSRVLKAMDAIRLEESDISPESRIIFERGLGRAMEHCIDSEQPAAALFLFNHASSTMARKDATLAERVKTFFGIEHSSTDHKAREKIFDEDNLTNLKDLGVSDPLLAAIIKAHRQLDQSEEAHSAYKDGTLHSNDTAFMAQSTNSALEALLDIDMDECMMFLDRMDAKSVNPSTFSVIARRYAEIDSWPEIGEIYNKARGAGCTSEDLSLVAMRSVCESELLDGKIVILRKIIDDVSSLVGMKSHDWINSRYWRVKRYVGFRYARLLMRWDDPETSQKEELLFAVREMRECAHEGVLAKNAPLYCIVRIAHLHDTEGRIKEVSLSDKQRRSAVNLLREACTEANRSGLMDSHFFTAEVVRGLRALKANKECIQMVRSLTSQGDKCKHKIAMETAMYAAYEEHDLESLDLITEVYEASGYDSSRLSIDHS